MRANVRENVLYSSPCSYISEFRAEFLQLVFGLIAKSVCSVFRFCTRIDLSGLRRGDIGRCDQIVAAEANIYHHDPTCIFVKHERQMGVKAGCKCSAVRVVNTNEGKLFCPPETGSKQFVL